MRQLLLVFWMLGSLVLCPYACMGQMAWAQGVTLSAPCCACCGDCARESGQDENRPPAPEEERYDCICYGAVLTSSVSQLLDDLAPAAFDAAMAIASAGETGLVTARQAGGLPAHELRPGRTLLLALHSLQI